MKLKKIASLALAGAMAVSMLAGCGVNGSTNSGSSTATTPASSIVDAVNKGQNANNAVKVTFTSSSNLDDAAKKAVDLYGDAVTPAQLKKAVEEYAPVLPTVTVRAGDVNDTFVGATGGFFTNETSGQNGAINPATPDPVDGEVRTYLNVALLGFSGSSEDYLMAQAAKNINTLVSKLDDTTRVTEEENDEKGWDDSNITESGEPYYDFSYTGQVSLVEVPTSAGMSYYYMVVVLNQTVTEQKEA